MNFYNNLNSSCDNNSHPSTITLNDLSFNNNNNSKNNNNTINGDKKSD